MARFTEWPSEVCFTLSQLDTIVEALFDAADSLPPDSAPFRAVRRAQITIWRKLWPELADLYDDVDNGDEE